MNEAALAESNGISVSLVARWTTIPSQPSALWVHALMCSAVCILPTTCWVDSTVRYDCLPALSRTRLFSESATASALGSSFVWPPELRTGSHCQSNSIGQLVGSITIRRLGKECFLRSGDLVSELDCIGF